MNAISRRKRAPKPSNVVRGEDGTEYGFYIKRVLAKRKKGKKTEWLALFDGYPPEYALWLSVDHFNFGEANDTLVYYDYPEPTGELIQDSIDLLVLEVKKCLLSGSKRHKFQFRHDVLRYLLREYTRSTAPGSRGWWQLTFDDFKSIAAASNHDPRTIDHAFKPSKTGFMHVGHSLMFPLELRHYIYWQRSCVTRGDVSDLHAKVEEETRWPVEMVSLRMRMEKRCPNLSLTSAGDSNKKKTNRRQRSARASIVTVAADVEAAVTPVAIQVPQSPITPPTGVVALLASSPSSESEVEVYSWK